jgi:glycyl-tRNA synthetase alpha chain
VLIKPSPARSAGALSRLARGHRHRRALHDIRFVEDDWESPTLGAWGLGWEVWCDGMEVSQFTYFQQVGGHDCKPVSGELTYGLERLAMYVLGIDHVMDMPFNDPAAPIPLTYGDVFRQTERNIRAGISTWPTPRCCCAISRTPRPNAQRILGNRHGAPGRATDPKTGKRIVMAHPAYDQCIKASHLFNLLDARGVISVTERQAYIGRVRALAKLCADASAASSSSQRFSACCSGGFRCMPTTRASPG